MPSLLLFASCDKVILEEQTKTISLISIFDNLDVPSPPASPESDSFVIAMHWYVATVWYPMEDEAPASYEQTCELVAPDRKTVKLTLRHEFALETGSHRIVSRILGFPGVRNGGVYSLVLYLRNVATEEDRTMITRYPISLRFIAEPK